MAFPTTINFPTVLTLTRLVLSVLLLPLLLVYLLPLNSFLINCLLALLFTVLCITDFFDGYLARLYKMETKLGKALDHIADKFLISSALISLLAVQKIYFFWVIILIIRELFVMGLREIALENNLCLSVSIYGKLKTAFQMLMLSVIILNPYQDVLLSKSSWIMLENVLIFITIFLSLFSAAQYYKEIINEI